MYRSFAFVSGLMFGIGLIVSGMVNPAKVLGFLDLAGRWDPSLALVMAGAIAVAVPGFFVAGRRHATLLGTPMLLPATRTIDARLVIGSVLFGAGWGLAGFCPGPALVALGAGYGKAVTFAAAMIAGMLVFEFVERARAAVPGSGATTANE
ncbi:MAG: YeeE/YedE family protein [Casimicrobiaceae bacterium]